MAAQLRDLTGLSFDQLTVIERGPNRNREAHWWCLCICGTRWLARVSSLVQRTTRSCPTCTRERTSMLGRIQLQTHGMYNSVEYGIWRSMLKRCLDPKHISYARYGGRGIQVCPAWRVSFQAFFSDVGPRPGPGYSLERLDNSKGYDKDNVGWSTPTEQARNRRTNHLLTYNGRTQCIEAWAEELHINSATLFYRLHHRERLGWSLEQVLMTPVHYRRKHRASNPPGHNEE